MRPIPKRLLIHTVFLYRREKVDKWGKEELDAGEELVNVRIEPSRQIIRDGNGQRSSLRRLSFSTAGTADQKK